MKALPAWKRFKSLSQEIINFLSLFSVQAPLSLEIPRALKKRAEFNELFLSFQYTSDSALCKQPTVVFAMMLGGKRLSVQLKKRYFCLFIVLLVTEVPSDYGADRCHFVLYYLNLLSHLSLGKL